MNLWKQLLLGAYYYGSYPRRAVQNRQLRSNGEAPVMVVFYHRIADDRPNPWTTPTRLFSRQIAWLKRHFDMVSLHEAQRRVESVNHRACVAITFDDGYAENCQTAVPLLIAERIPCTYFVTTHNMLTGGPFPHDVARGCPLAPNTPDQIRELAQAGIEIGAHTRTHMDLTSVQDPDRLYDELVAPRQQLQELTGTPVRHFAFPFGQHANLDCEAFALAREAGYEGVCSAYGGFNFPGDDAFHLQRIHADDDMIRLKNWMTLDPRKLHMIERFEYQQHEAQLLAAAGAHEWASP